MGKSGKPCWAGSILPCLVRTPGAGILREISRAGPMEMHSLSRRRGRPCGSPRNNYGNRSRLSRGIVPEHPAPWFPLSEQRLYIMLDDDGFYHRYLPHRERSHDGSGSNRDFATMVYSMLAYLLERTKVKPQDILTCANPQCGVCFVPLRRPHAGQRSFCSMKCGALVASQNYRRRHKADLNERITSGRHRR
jgi:hypothetical protein